jgi:N-acylglucosamine-6-phosphate 2-epimerase
MSVLDPIVGGLVVSCQAPSGSPLRDPFVMSRIALAALAGGAVGLRVNGTEDIRAIRPLTPVPIIGLQKVLGERRNIITPSLEAARGLVDAGADIVAIDATTEVLGSGFDLLSVVARELGCSIMADVSTLDEGLRAWDAGATVIGTTLSGYTPYTQPSAEDPDIDLVRALAERGLPVIAEGRYRSPAQMQAAFEAGALAVVVGGAITDPLSTTQRFAAMSPRMAE